MNGLKKTVIKMPTLETSRLILRKIEKDDYKDINEYSSNPEVSRFLTWSEHESLDYTKEYTRYIIKKYKTGEFLDWALVLKANSKMIGTCGFTSFDIANSKAEIGYVISDDYWNNSYATEAVQRVMEYAFLELGINRLEARTMVGNIASEKLLEKCGFCLEGVFTDELYVKGEFRTIKHFAICKKDYMK